MDVENTDIIILLVKVPVNSGDVITIRKDGTVLLNGAVQVEDRMELM